MTSTSLAGLTAQLRHEGFAALRFPTGLFSHLASDLRPVYNAGVGRTTSGRTAASRMMG
jgi:hypothetical protein